MSRIGPEIRVEVSCFGCTFCKSESYAVQGDSGHNVSCTHPDTADSAIGDTTWRTPSWCPLLDDAMSKAIEAAAKKGKR